MSGLCLVFDTTTKMIRSKSHRIVSLPLFLLASLLALFGCTKSENKTEENESKGETVVKASKPVSSRPLSESTGNANDKSEQEVYIVPNKKIEPDDLKALKDKTKKKVKQKDESEEDRS